MNYRALGVILGGVLLIHCSSSSSDPSVAFDPKHGVSPAMDVLVMVFPNTSLNSYRDETERSLNIKSQRLYEKAQGWPDLKCLVKP